MRTTEVVVIGSGFGGLAAVKQLAKSNIETTLISANGTHLFQPLLYQVATGVVGARRIAPPIAQVLRRRRTVDVVTGLVTAIDADRKVVSYATDEGIEQIGYRYLIVAAGAAQAYFGHDEWADRTFALKTLDDAQHLRVRVMRAFDAHAGDAARTFVVVGAGATGVEVAGQLAELANSFNKKLAIYLVEGADDVLPFYGGTLSGYTRAALGKDGVKVLTNTVVTAIDQSTDGEQTTVTVKGEADVEREIVAGTVADVLAAATGCETDRAGRLRINRDLTVGGRADVFAIGDMTSLDALPGQSPVAMQQGRHAADIIRGKKAPGAHFRYFDKGSMAMIDTPHAVVHAPMNLKLTGLIAWAGWLAVHLYYLVGLGNRAAVATDWLRTFLGNARPGFEEATRKPSAGVDVPGLPDRPRDVPVA